MPRRVPTTGPATEPDAGTLAVLAVLAVSPASRVLTVGLRDLAMAEALSARGCSLWSICGDEATARLLKPLSEEVVVADLADPDLASAFSGIPFDVVFAVGVLDVARRPDLLVQTLAALLPARARLVASVANATHVNVRIRGLQTRSFEESVDASPRFDLAGLHALLDQAGLTPIEVLRVHEPALEDPTVPPAVMTWLHSDPEALAAQLIVVAESRDVSNAYGTSLAEHLQERIRHVEEAWAESRDRASELETALDAADTAREAAEAALASALDALEQHDVDNEARVAELEETLRQRMAELDSLDHALKLLQADLALKEAFALELRLASQQADIAANAAREEADHLRRTLAIVEVTRDAERAELLRLREVEEELARVRARAGYRLLERASAQLAAMPPLMLAAKWAARRINRAR